MTTATCDNISFFAFIVKNGFCKSGIMDVPHSSHLCYYEHIRYFYIWVLKQSAKCEMCQYGADLILVMVVGYVCLWLRQLSRVGPPSIRRFSRAAKRRSTNFRALRRQRHRRPKMVQHSNPHVSSIKQPINCQIKHCR